MRALVVILILLCVFIESFSQNLQLIGSIEIEEPTEVSVDRAGNIYFSTYNGDIVSYSPLLKERAIFSPSNPSTTTILEAWQGLRIFSFHRDLQQYRLINRNLSLNEDYSFPTDLIGFAEMATPSYDNNIWVIDQIDFSLKKYDIFSKQIKTRTSLDFIFDPDNYEILHCKEYQNKLFVSTKKYGILIFDNFGNYLKTYQIQGVSFFNFWDDMIYFIEGKVLVKHNLYSEEIIYTELPDEENCLFPLVYEDRTYLFFKNKLTIYK